MRKIKSFIVSLILLSFSFGVSEQKPFLDSPFWRTSTTAKPAMSLINQNGDANGASITLQKESNTRADNDILGDLSFKYYNIGYARIRVQASDVTQSSEDGKVVISTMKDGTLTEAFNITGTTVNIAENAVVVGTVNATAFVGILSGQADTVATITGLAPDTATTQAAQPNITRLGTITALSATTGTFSSNYAKSVGATSRFKTPRPNLTGDFEMEIDLKLLDYTPSAIVQIYNTLDTGGIRIGINANGTFFITVRSSGDGAATSAAPNLVDGQRYIIKIVWEDGVGVSFYVNDVIVGAQVALVKTVLVTSLSDCFIFGAGDANQELYSFTLTPTAGTSLSLNPNDWSTGTTFDSAETGEVWTLDNSVSIESNEMTFDGGGIKNSGIHTNSNATTSTSTTSGALKVAGGVGIVENLNVGGEVNVSGNLDLSTTGRIDFTTAPETITEFLVSANRQITVNIGGTSMLIYGLAL